MLELSPTDDYAHYALGRALEKQGREAEANGHYKLASSMNPRERELRRAASASSSSHACEPSSSASRARERHARRRDRRRPLRAPRRRGRRRRARDAERLAGKVARLRIFEGDDGKFDRSLLDTGGAALVVSQFTLIADTRKGNRPSFTDAARPELAEPLYERFCAALRELGVDGRDGRLRRPDGARARERRAGDDRSRLTGAKRSRSRALLPFGHHISGKSKWARGAHFL